MGQLVASRARIDVGHAEFPIAAYHSGVHSGLLSCENATFIAAQGLLLQCFEFLTLANQPQSKHT